MPHWLPLVGTAEIRDESTLFFRGGKLQPATEGVPPVYNIALVMNGQQFGGGTISADVQFDSTPTYDSLAGFVLNRQPANETILEAQFGGSDLCSLWTFGPAPQGGGNTWFRHGGTGASNTIEASRTYHIEVQVIGSNMQMAVDGVHVLSASLPYPLPLGNPGVWLRGPSNITVTNYALSTVTPTAFVVMQFTPPYDELYEEVIKPACNAVELRAVRADDTFGPGVIIQDIERQISEARLVIADITPQNLNVYYEVGYSHALKKDTILVAEKPAKLPFDVSPFRVLFYENTISGKKKVDEGLKKHLAAILGRR